MKGGEGFKETQLLTFSLFFSTLFTTHSYFVHRFPSLLSPPSPSPSEQHTCRQRDENLSHSSLFILRPSSAGVLVFSFQITYLSLIMARRSRLGSTPTAWSTIFYLLLVFIAPLAFINTAKAGDADSIRESYGTGKPTSHKRLGVPGKANPNHQ